MSDEEKIEEETYSTIFSSLKHPIRRKILRMLAREPRTFSEILEAVSIDSGHLNYHLENLGDLITHSPDGKYGLSSVGVAAVKLMSGVEEHPPVAILLKSRRRAALNIITKITVIVLIVALIASSLFFIGFWRSAESINSKGGGVDVEIAPNQIFEYNVTFVPKEEGITVGIGLGNPFILERVPVKTITEWETGSFGFDFDFNVTYDTIMRLYDPTGMTNEWRDSGGPCKQSFYAGEITQPGTYRLQIQNIGSEPLTGHISPSIDWHCYERPYFYWGIVGLLIASAYPAFALVRRIWG